MIWSIAAAVLSAAAVLLCVVILWKLHGFVRRSGDNAPAAERLRRELAELDARTAQRLSLLKQEVDTSVKNQNQPILTGIAAMTDTNDRRLAQMQATLESRLQFLQEDNARKLESMRATVDEKLTSTLEKRLNAQSGESAASVPSNESKKN